MIALIKFIHITAIVIWSAGLIAFPGFYLQLGYLRSNRPEIGLHGEAVLRLQKAARLTYVGIVSPAAFVAIASGTVLIFQRGLLAPWFSLKLAFVAGLVVAHTMTRITLTRLFEQNEDYSAWHYITATGSTLALAAVIVTLTLAKPTLPETLLPVALSEPGALKGIVKGINPWQRS